MAEDIEKKIMDKGFESRKLLKENNFGVLSTISLDVPGYPFGSIVPYCLSGDLEPLMLISNIAQHTKNILADPKVSLTVFNPNSGDVQANGRVTYIGDALKVDDNQLIDKYKLYFPAAAEYFKFHDFSLFKIEFKKLRFIGGFGSIFWLEKEGFLLQNPLADVEKRIVGHMNDDHKESIIKYCRVIKSKKVENALMLGIDSEGFDVLGDNQFFRFSFDEPVTDAGKAREVLVKMARMPEI
jgi:putative heme iron utilization protein